jgi:hypothetical protein
VSIVGPGVENLREESERLVDLVWTDESLAELCGFVAVHVLGADLIEPRSREVREQVLA